MLRTLALLVIVTICLCPTTSSMPNDSDLINGPAVDILTSDDERPFNLTITSNEVSEPIEVDNGTIVNSDRIRLNAFFPNDVVNPENDVVNVSLMTQTGFLVEASDELIIPSDWYDPFTMYMNYSCFNWVYTDVVETNEVVDITLNFTNDDCDVLVWWNDTSQVSKIYATNLVGNQMASNDTPLESGSFVAERSGILAIGIFNFALQDGTYNLTVDTRESIFVTEVGNNASIDTWTWNRNVTFSMEVVGYSLAGPSFFHNYSSLTFNNYFVPTIEHLYLVFFENIVTIEWEISDRNQNDTLLASVLLSTDNGVTYSLLQSNVSESQYVWDSSGFLPRDSYVVKINVIDSSGLTSERVSLPFFAGDPNPPAYRVSIGDPPDDISFNEGTIGNEIVWQVTVHSPYTASYQVHKDGELYRSGSLESGDLVVNVDGLSPNTYRFILTVISGTEIQTDAVRVTVIPMRSLPMGYSLMLPGLAIILIASSITVIEYHRKQKKIE